MKSKIFRFPLAVAAFALFCLIGGAPVFAQSVTVLSDIDMGIIEKSAGAVGNLTQDTTGSITCAAGFICPATGTTGRLQVTGTTGARLRIRCERNKILRNNTGSDGSQDQDADEIYIRVGTSGTELTCGGGWTFDGNVSANPANNVIYVGMRFVADDAMWNGQYSMGTHPNGELSLDIRIGNGGGAYNATRTVDGLVGFEGIVSITASTNMDYGEISLAATPASGDRAELGTDGSINYAGNFSGPVTGTAGSATIGGIASGDIVEVYCSSSATLAGPAGSTIDMTGIEMAVLANQGGYGSGWNCNGAGTPAVVGAYVPTTQDTIFLGGVLDGGTASGTISGDYSTSNPGGSFVDVTFIKQ
ncbi:MAG: hypothetical protein EP349_09265 [Alphaproteobacteria bacterium]|nr:MAG: hypothetical protein EP349_09265 [Alphaproteobacteria bacterium]